MSVPYQDLDSIDWSTWEPDERATLMFILRGHEVLLIHKKRGFGRGKINGPGGRMEPGETARECAIREVQEEVLVHPTGVEECGELFFQFQDGFSIHGVVFRASGHEGEPGETDEALPFWVGREDIPYERMWEDDRHWLPLALNGERFVGRFLFDGDSMIDYHIRVKE